MFVPAHLHSFSCKAAEKEMVTVRGVEGAGAEAAKQIVYVKEEETRCVEHRAFRSDEGAVGSAVDGSYSANAAKGLQQQFSGFVESLSSTFPSLAPSFSTTSSNTSWMADETVEGSVSKEELGGMHGIETERPYQRVERSERKRDRDSPISGTVHARASGCSFADEAQAEMTSVTPECQWRKSRSTVSTASTLTKGLLHVEAVVRPTCTAALDIVRTEVQSFVDALGGGNASAPSHGACCYKAGPIDLDHAPDAIRRNCASVSIVDIDVEWTRFQSAGTAKQSLHASAVGNIVVHAFVLSEEEAETEELEDTDDQELTACEALPLPHKSLHGLWESLIISPNVKRHLLDYVQTALLFADRGVDSHLINCNRVVLLHGPPGTGKTSLCRALAHKLTLRLSAQGFPNGGHLLEIHAHSLFSKWFSESGKLVNRLFARIREMVEDDPQSLVCVLVDEVESLAAARGSAGGSSGGEPSDAIRAVNSLLTALDRLRRYRNVVILSTTNLTGSVDVAFIDRADIKQYIGLPPIEARYEILRSCVAELVRVGIVAADTTEGVTSLRAPFNGSLTHSGQQMTSAEESSPLPSYRQMILDLAEIDQQSNVESTERSPAVSHMIALRECALDAADLSGRTLRKLPFQSFASQGSVAVSRQHGFVSMTEFLAALRRGVLAEQESRGLVGISNRPSPNTR